MHDVPVTISPDVPGHWQWIGTRTLRFDADSLVIDRLPMATAFTVTVPAGTTSATGGELAEAVSWSFTTPPPTVQSFTPQGESLRRDQIFVAREALDRGSEFLAIVLYEEWLHKRHKLRDNSREMQTFLLGRMVHHALTGIPKIRSKVA